MDGKERTIRKEVHLAKTSPHRDRGWQTDYPRVGSGSRNLRFAKRAAKGVHPARVWLANNVQVLRDITTHNNGRTCPQLQGHSSLADNPLPPHACGLLGAPRYLIERPHPNTEMDVVKSREVAPLMLWMAHKQSSGRVVGGMEPS